MHDNHIFLITHKAKIAVICGECVSTRTHTHACGNICAYMFVCMYVCVAAAATGCQRFVAICCPRLSYTNMQQQNVFHRLIPQLVATELHATTLFFFFCYCCFIISSTTCIALFIILCRTSCCCCDYCCCSCAGCCHYCIRLRRIIAIALQVASVAVGSCGSCGSWRQRGWRVICGVQFSFCH